MAEDEVERVYGSAVAANARRGLKLRLPALRAADGQYTVGGLMLVFFASRVGRVATKAELAEFLRNMKCETLDTQPRHLGMQNGLNFLVQGCYHPRARRTLRRGEYCLLDLCRAHPSHSTMHRAKAELSWAPIKALYGDRCACCGSREGETHLKNAHLVTTLEKGHCDPRKPLSSDNCIPMCKLCNMVYKDHAVLSRRGFVVKWLKDGGPPSTGDDDDDEEEAKASAAKAKVPAVKAKASAAKAKTPAVKAKASDAPPAAPTASSKVQEEDGSRRTWVAFAWASVGSWVPACVSIFRTIRDRIVHSSITQ